MNWRFYQYGIVPVAMPHEVVELSKQDQKALFNKYKKGLYIRYSSGFDVYMGGGISGISSKTNHFPWKACRPKHVIWLNAASKTVWLKKSQLKK